MNAYVSAFLQPLYQHLQTILCKFLSGLIGALVIVAEPRSGVFFLDTTPVRGRQDVTAPVNNQRTGHALLGLLPRPRSSQLAHVEYLLYQARTK